MRSNRTTAEFETAAMLLGPGWGYDWMDHTFVGPPHSGDTFTFDILDADTMAPVEFGDEVAERTEMVRKGQLGPSDAYPTQRKDQMPLHGEDDPQTPAATRGDTS